MYSELKSRTLQSGKCQCSLHWRLEVVKPQTALLAYAHGHWKFWNTWKFCQINFCILLPQLKSVLTCLCKRPLTPATEPGEGTLHGAARYTVTSAEVAGLVITPSRENGGSSVFSCLHLPSKYSRPYRACLSKLQQNPWLMLGLFHTWLTGFSKCEVFLYN